jgi:hypothetical protein
VQLPDRAVAIVRTPVESAAAQPLDIGGEVSVSWPVGAAIVLPSDAT